jgi:uncharacterized protein (TIGR03437 family)
MFRALLLLTFAAALLPAQIPAPVVDPRGVLNEFTLQPAPTSVAPGAILRVNGLNLGPAEGVSSSGSPLPIQLGDPPVQVLVNNRPAGLFSVTPSRIICQVPVEIQPGIAQLIGRRGDAASAPVRFNILAAIPSIRLPTPATPASSVTLRATGLGATEPRVASGEAGPANPPAAPRVPVHVFLDGRPLNATTVLSVDRVGEFDVSFDLPSGSSPGDLIQLFSAGRAANLVPLGKAENLAVTFLPLPAGASEFRSLQTSDLRGSFAAVNGPRNDDGCYPAMVFDFARMSATPVDSCLISANRNANSPFIVPADAPSLAAFLGPEATEPGNGVSAKVRVFNPALAQPLDVALPSPASAITATADGNLVAVLPGNPPKAVSIDVSTGETREVQLQPGQAGGQGTAPGLGNPGLLNPANLKIDLGDGLTHPLSAPVLVAQNSLAMIVGDDPEKPTKAKLAILSLAAEVAATRDFPSDRLPLFAPPIPQRPGQQPPTGQGAALNLRLPVSTFFDQQSRLLFVPLRSADGARHALGVFSFDETAPRAVDLPDGWFFTACTASIPVFNLELSRRLAFFASRVAETQFRPQCPAQGFLVFSLANRNLNAIPLPGAGQLNASANSGDINDFLFGTNTDSTQQNSADTLYLFDGAAASTFRFDLPAAVSGFTGANPVPALNLIVASARNRTPGDAGLILFDLERTETRLLPTPDGFDSIALLSIFPAARKLIARGLKSDNAGSQLLIYDLASGDLQVVPNPDGVVWAGPLPPAPGQPQAGPYQRANPKTNTVTALGFDAVRLPVGLLLLRVP